MEVVRKLLSADEFSPTNQRYNGDCDCIEQTPDGGTTWVPVDGLDPRHSIGFQRPPNVTANTQCDAAASMVRFTSDFVSNTTNHVNDGITILGWISFLIALLTPLFPPALFVALFIDLFDLITGTGATVVADAFTSTVYDDLLCIYFCNMNADGQVDASQLTDILAQIDAQIGGVAGTVLHSILQLQGEVGLTNAGALGLDTDDCSACECIDPPALQIQVIGGTHYGDVLTEISSGVWQCTSHDFSSENHWVLLETVDPARKFQVTDVTLISGGGGFPWYRDFPSRATDEYVQADPTDVPNVNGCGQSRPDTGAFTIQFTIIDSS